MNPQNKILRKGSCKKGEIVFYDGKPILVQEVLDYDPERRKSYVKGCALDGSGNPLLGVDILPGYEWSFKNSC